MSEVFEPFNQEELEPYKPKRPNFLTVIAILSFITIGYTGLNVILSLVTGPPTEEAIDTMQTELTKSAVELRESGASGLANFMEQTAELAVYQQVNFWLYLGITAITAIAGFIGVLYMWKLRKIGFQFYIIYSLLSAGSMYIIAPVSAVPAFFVISSLVISGNFVAMYAAN